MMKKKLMIAFVSWVALVSTVSAESSSWQALHEISPGQTVQVVQMDLRSIEGEFTGFDERSISVRKKGRTLTYARPDIFRVSLRGGTRRKRNALIGLIAGMGAGFVLGTVATRKDEGWEFISDEAVTASLTAIGGGAGALIGSAIPSRDYRTIYRARLAPEQTK